jgi:Methyltransferase domain
LKENSKTAVTSSWKSNCEIHTFDPDPRYARENDSQVNNIHYHPWGLKSSDEAFSSGRHPKESQFYSFQEIRTKLKHEDRRIDILKIDCESCEWSTYEDWIRPEVDVRQVLLETHTLPEKPNTFFDRFMDTGFVIFKKEINSHPSAKPCCAFIEWGFLRLHTNFLMRNATIMGL